jgi:pyruvate/2-oxoglutarate dehydrogenase complex dihydrolipoamide dehydrogenase (E3) component
MAVEYDLVVVGATAAAQAAAIAAARTHARVAWATETTPLCDPLLLLRESCRLVSQRPDKPSPQGLKIAAELLASTLPYNTSPATAQAEGVNCLEGPFLFEAEGLTIAGQSVRSRAYLLAIEPEQPLPSIPGILHPKVWTIAQIYQALQSPEKAWPQNIGVLGAGPQAVELSQSLQRLGISVVLLTGGGPLLPQEDQEAAFLVQTYLEGSGIEIYSQELLLAVQASPEELTLEMSDCKIVVNALIIATESPGLLPSSLAALNLRQTAHSQTAQGQTARRIWVNSSLQTSNPSIYACGGLLGGYRLPSLGRYEALLAVRNALFEKQDPLQYHQVPYAISSDPPLARVGLSECQALRYDSQAQIIRQTYLNTDRGILAQVPAGLCKVLVQPDGTILGAHIVGAHAPEIIHLFAFAIHQGIRLQDLANRGYASPTFAQVVQSVSETWQWMQSQKDRDHHERWFYQRRRKA